MRVRTTLRLWTIWLVCFSSLPAQPTEEVPRLIEALKDDDGYVRSRAAIALGHIGPAAEAAAPALIAALKDDDRFVRSSAASALGRIGPAAEAVPALIEALRDDDGYVRSSAADALGIVGPAAEAAVPVLIEALKDDNSWFRNSAASALGRIGPAAEAAVPALIEALRYDDAALGGNATDALERIGPAAEAAVPALIEALRYDDSRVRRRAADALQVIANGSLGARDFAAIPYLQRALTALDEVREEEAARKLRIALEALQEIKNDQWLERLLARASNNPRIALGVGLAGIYLLWLVVLRFGILRLWPLRVLAWNEALEPYTDFKLPSWLGEGKLPVRFVLGLGFFHHHRRVLDAWVEQHIDTARANFREIPTFKERQTYVPLPVVLNGNNIANLTVEQLRNTCGRDRWAVLIQGEGGLGKTTLACQLALWAMADDPAERLCDDRRMLPVLIEPGHAFDIRRDMETFEAEIRGRLQKLVGAARPIPEGLFQELLRTRRILVILDGLSEMPSALDAPGAVRPENPDFSPNALLVTSRTDEQLSREATIQPSRIDSGHLAGFMNAYATQSGQANLEDAALFEACRGLAEMVSAGGQEVTPLLAKLYAEQLVALSERGEALENLPASVPDLMLSYLNELNRVRQEADPDDPTVHRAAAITAWECLRKTYGPGQGKKEDVRAELCTVDLSEELPAYLEDRLRVIRTIAPAKTHVQFVMDPLSEYLAGLRLVELYGNSEEKWRAFLDQADLMPGSPEAIKGFLLAVRDCCEAKGAEHRVPDFVAEELGKRAGLDPEVVERARMQGRVQQLIQNLRSFEPKDRAYACARLQEIGPAAEAAVPALVVVLGDDNWSVRSSAASALGRIGPAAEAAVPALSEALKDDDTDVRSSAASALGRIGPAAEAAVPALSEALKHDDSGVRRSAAFALGSSGPAAVPALIEALKDDDTTVRSAAAFALVRIGPTAEAAVPALIEALMDDDSDVRRSAASALGRIGRVAEAAMPALGKALTDDDGDVRTAARSALENIRTGTP